MMMREFEIVLWSLLTGKEQIARLLEKVSAEIGDQVDSETKHDTFVKSVLNHFVHTAFLVKSKVTTESELKQFKV